MTSDSYVEQFVTNYEQAVSGLNQQREKVADLQAELDRHDDIWRSHAALGAEVPESVRNARNFAYQAHGKALGALAPLERKASDARRKLDESRQYDVDRAWRLKGEVDYQQEIDAAESALVAVRKHHSRVARQHLEAANRVAAAQQAILEEFSALESLNELQEERTLYLGQAYAAGKSADLFLLDERIADGELELHAKKMEAEGATAALSTLERRVEALASRLSEHLAKVHRAEGAWERAAAAMEAHRLSLQVESLVGGLVNLQAVNHGLAHKLVQCWLSEGLLVPGPREILELPASLRDSKELSILAAQRLQTLRKERDERVSKTD